MALERSGHLTSAADLKAQPGPAAPTLARVPAGARIAILAQQAMADGHAWQRVRFRDKEGFVEARLVAADDATFAGTVMERAVLPLADLPARGGPGLGAAPVGDALAPGTALTFDAWALGSAHRDPLVNQYDDRWFRLRGTARWVPSAYIRGQPPATLPPLAAPHYKTVLHELLNRVNITDVAGGFPGQCVSFVKQYTHLLGVEMGPKGGIGGAFEAFANFDQPGLSLQATQATRIAFTGREQPREGDIVIFDQTPSNQFGHIGVAQAIVADGIFILEQSNFDTNAPTEANPNGVTSVDCGVVILRHALPPGSPDRVLGGLGRVLGWLRLRSLH